MRDLAMGYMKNNGFDCQKAIRAIDQDISALLNKSGADKEEIEVLMDAKNHILDYEKKKRG